MPSSRRIKAFMVSAFVLLTVCFCLYSQGGGSSLISSRDEITRRAILRASLDDAAATARRDVISRIHPREIINARAEVNRLIATHPIIIWSMTWCQYSSKAKQLLLDTYHIDPVPHVVELDKVKDGAQMKKIIAERVHKTSMPVSTGWRRVLQYRCG